MFETLPDYPQARYLATALWRKKGQARGAALIVGTGVSTMALFVQKFQSASLQKANKLARSRPGLTTTAESSAWAT